MATLDDWDIQWLKHIPNLINYYSLPDDERHLRLLYRDILKFGYCVTKVERDEDDYVVYLEKTIHYEDGGEALIESCWRLQAQ